MIVPAGFQRTKYRACMYIKQPLICPAMPRSRTAPLGYSVCGSETDHRCRFLLFFISRTTPVDALFQKDRPDNKTKMNKKVIPIFIRARADCTQSKGKETPETTNAWQFSRQPLRIPMPRCSAFRRNEGARNLKDTLDAQTFTLRNNLQCNAHIFLVFKVSQGEVMNDR